MADNSEFRNDERMPRMVRPHDVTLDAEYADWIRDIKRRNRSA